MLDLADYELVWPPELFAAEARRILTRERVSAQAIDLLLREAFRDDSAAEDLAAPVPFSSWSSGAVARQASEMLAELAKNAHVIRRFSAPRPYWPQRLGREVPGPYLDASEVRRGFADLVGELERTGYLDQAFPRPCVDDQYASEPDPAAELEKRLGIAGLWPLAPDEWDDSTFYGLIEVYHDLVSRPRERHYHDYSRCGWHYCDAHRYLSLTVFCDLGFRSRFPAIVVTDSQVLLASRAVPSDGCHQGVAGGHLIFRV